MANSRIVGIFRSDSSVEKLLGQLNDHHFTKDEISVVCKKQDSGSGGTMRPHSTATYPDVKTKDSTEIMESDTRGDVLQKNEPSLEERFDVKEKDPNAMVKGAAAGGTIGLLAGLAALMIPGVGPVLAVGPLAAAITAAASGAALGATAGTITGLLNDEGIPAERANFYEEHFKDGHIIVMLHVDNEKKQGEGRRILEQFDPVTVDSF